MAEGSNMSVDMSNSNQQQQAENPMLMLSQLFELLSQNYAKVAELCSKLSNTPSITSFLQSPNALAKQHSRKKLGIPKDAWTKVELLNLEKAQAEFGDDIDRIAEVIPTQSKEQIKKLIGKYELAGYSNSPSKKQEKRKRDEESKHQSQKSLKIQQPQPQPQQGSKIKNKSTEKSEPEKTDKEKHKQKEKESKKQGTPSNSSSHSSDSD